MVPFYAMIQQHALVILQLASPAYIDKATTETYLFLHRQKWILRGLTEMLLHDPGPSAPSNSVRLLSAEVYERILPIVLALYTPYAGESDKYYEKRATSTLKPLVVQLAVTANSDALWKPLNYQLFMLTRDESAIVRYALICLIVIARVKLEGTWRWTRSPPSMSAWERPSSHCCPNQCSSFPSSSRTPTRALRSLPRRSLSV